jgi:uncharacterized membrane protein
MQTSQPRLFFCPVCKKHLKPNEGLSGDLLRTPIAELIRKQYPDWSSQGFICFKDLNHFRAEYVKEILETEKGELSLLEQDVISSLKEQEVLSKDVNEEFDRQLRFRERVADAIAVFGGSWTFILSFMLVLAVWIIVNSVVSLWRPFDPYPYILLNLVLSCIAALQAPVIMMSQNRLETKDRLRSTNDYGINLKAEVEIRQLNAKLDQMMNHQWQRLMEIQQIQMELMEELMLKKKA